MRRCDIGIADGSGVTADIVGGVLADCAELARANFLLTSPDSQERRIFLDVEVSNDVPELL